ncbi:MAG TPA: ubiquinol-cytochrome C chaperone family protein [Arenibaculum sp.]|nr:ubiquinol-cytochrome C chaperone family protein [Arenibaculum sp.]
MGLFRRKPFEHEGRALYAGMVAQARRPEFYEAAGVPDTLDGRFDMIVLHAFLVLHRMKGPDGERGAKERGPMAGQVGRAMTEALFADMDASLRELGFSDLAVGKRVKQMIDGFYGRMDAYERGLASEDDGHALRVALDNNLYGTVPTNRAGLDLMAAYVRREAERLGSGPLGPLLAGEVTFGPPPAAPGA